MEMKATSDRHRNRCLFEVVFVPKRRIIALQDAYALFLVDREARGQTEQTLAYYRGKLGRFISWATDVQRVCGVDQVTPGLIRSYFVELQSRGLSPYTIHGVSRGIRAFCNWCTAEGLLTASPMTNVPNPRLPKTILPAFSPEEVRRLVNAAPDERTRALILFMLDTGLRASEMMALNGADIDMRSGEVRVRLGKGQKDRTVYLGATSRRALLKYYGKAGWPEPDEPVWRHQHGDERLQGTGLRKLLAIVGKEAGVDNATPHTFRRTFALWSLRAGVNVHTLAKLMGHADIQVLRQYLDLVDGDLAAAHHRAGIVDKLFR